jgi:hypothetical protein
MVNQQGKDRTCVVLLADSTVAPQLIDELLLRNFVVYFECEFLLLITLVPL